MIFNSPFANNTSKLGSFTLGDLYVKIVKVRLPLQFVRPALLRLMQLLNVKLDPLVGTQFEIQIYHFIFDKDMKNYLNLKVRLHYDENAAFSR